MARRTKKPERPVRDWLDYATFVVGVLGFGAVIYTIIDTYHSGAKNDRNTADAIAAMRNIATEMKNDRPLLKQQATAAESAATAAAKSANAADTQAEISKTQAAAATSLAATTAQQLRQSARLFAYQQRPIIVAAPEERNAQRAPVVLDNMALWNFAWKNIGASPAYNIEVFYGFKIGALPIKEWAIGGSGSLPPNILQYNTARQPFVSEDGDVPLDQPVALVVHFKFEDAAGNTFWDSYCKQPHSNGAVSNCDGRYDDELTLIKKAGYRRQR